MTEELKVSFAGIGATGAVLAAALLSADHQVALVDPKPGLDDKPIIFRLLSNKGIQRIFQIVNGNRLQGNPPSTM